MDTNRELYIQEQLHEIGNNLSADSIRQLRYAISYLIEKHNSLLVVLETMGAVRKNMYIPLKVNISRRQARGI